MIDQHRMPLLEALIKYKFNKSTSFHTPGHVNGAGAAMRFTEAVGSEVLKCDATEIQGLDDYHNAEGAIAEAQRLAADAWGSEKALFLVNGTTSGVMAAICALTFEGDGIIVQRNSHESVHRGLITSGAKPIYVLPEFCKETGFAGSVDPADVRRLLMMHDSVKAIFLTSPTYYGVYSDLKSIIHIAHTFRIPVIVDEAHGGHVYFGDGFPKGAVTLGADIVIQSTHKTIGSMTQSSMIHYGGELIDFQKIESNVKLLQSTSPSYILMSSLDAARYNMYINGKKIFKERLEMCNSVRAEIRDIPGIKCLDNHKGCFDNIYDSEKLRLIITAEDCGLTGLELSQVLNKSYNIDVEFADTRYIICLVGPGTSLDDLSTLTSALRSVSENNHDKNHKSISRYSLQKMGGLLPAMALTPREAHFKNKIAAEWHNCVGCISGINITPYPPGVPFVIKGEIISKEIHTCITELLNSGMHIHGLEKRGNKWHSYILDTAQ